MFFAANAVLKSLWLKLSPGSNFAVLVFQTIVWPFVGGDVLVSTSDKSFILWLLISLTVPVTFPVRFPVTLP